MSRYTCPGTQSWPYFFEVSSVTPVDAPSGDFILRYEKRQTFFSVNTPGYFPTYLHLCIIHLPFVQPFYILFRFSLYVPCKLRFLIYV